MWLVLTRITVFPARPEFRRIAVFDRLIRESDLSRSSSTDLEPVRLRGRVQSDLDSWRTGGQEHWTELRLDGDTTIPSELVADARLADVDLRVEVVQRTRTEVQQVLRDVVAIATDLLRGRTEGTSSDGVLAEDFLVTKNNHRALRQLLLSGLLVGRLAAFLDDLDLLHDLLTKLSQVHLRNGVCGSQRLVLLVRDVVQRDNREDRDAQRNSGRHVSHPVALCEVEEVVRCAIVIDDSLGVGLARSDSGRNRRCDTQTRDEDLRVGLNPVKGKLDGVLDGHGCASFLKSEGEDVGGQVEPENRACGNRNEIGVGADRQRVNKNIRVAAFKIIDDHNVLDECSAAVSHDKPEWDNRILGLGLVSLISSDRHTLTCAIYEGNILVICWGLFNQPNRDSVEVLANEHTECSRLDLVWADGRGVSQRNGDEAPVRD
nr:MAG TPA: hypothetical protein [Caudoviricetes sp.]